MLLRAAEPSGRARKAILSSRLKRIDWDFSGYSCASAFAVVHWHPCRFVAQIPASLIGLLSEKGGTVLDPFCGAGTTLVEAQRLGRKPVGIDLNPVSTLLSRSKLIPKSSHNIGRAIDRYKGTLLEELRRKEANSVELLSAIPRTVQWRKWYHEETARQLGFLWDFVSRTKSSYKDVLLGAFSAILISVCNETRHWGYICDNTQPKSKRRVDAVATYIGALEKYAAAYKERDELLGEGVIPPLTQADVITSDAHLALSSMKDHSVDLAVTSPPYFGVCDYIKAQRLSLEWLGIDIEPLRKVEVGARSKRHRQTAIEDYTSELETSLEHITRVLQRGGHVALVLGDSKVRSATVPAVVKSLKKMGLSVLLDEERSVSIQRRQHPSITEERVIVAKRN